MYNLVVVNYVLMLILPPFYESIYTIYSITSIQQSLSHILYRSNAMSQVIVSHKNLLYLYTSLKYDYSIIILTIFSYLEFSEFRCDGSSMWLTFPDFEREKQITTSAKSQSVELTKQKNQ